MLDHRQDAQESYSKLGSGLERGKLLDSIYENFQGSNIFLTTQKEGVLLGRVRLAALNCSEKAGCLQHKLSFASPIPVAP